VAISDKSFFTITLILPIVVGCLGWIFPAMDGVTFIWHYAAVPYVACAGCLALLIRRTTNRSQVAALTICAPLLMCAFMWVYFVVIDPPELRSFARIWQLASVVPIVATVGYAFVGFAWVGHVVARRAGWVEQRSKDPKTI
jgi:hypothetical protein